MPILSKFLGSPQGRTLCPLVSTDMSFMFICSDNSDTVEQVSDRAVFVEKQGATHEASNTHFAFQPLKINTATT